MNKLLVILGSTATGKTDLALQLARKFQGELVACDSRQVYKGLDIGTGKLPTSSVILRAKPEGSNYILRYAQNDSKKTRGYWLVGGIKIWMYDLVSPKIQYTVADFVKDADRVIREIQGRGKLPIIVGGTGFYLKALLEGLPNLEVPVDMDLRKKLETFNLEQLQEELKKLYSKKWESLNESDSQNPRRLIRAIELSLSSLLARPRLPDGQGTNLGRINSRSRLPRPFGARNDVLSIGLTAPRKVLYKNVDERVLVRVKQGMVDEAKYLCSGGLSLKRMRQLGLEYGVLADYLSGKIREIEGDQGLIKIMQRKIHGYVRRQLTWFKKEKDVSWFDITQNDYINNVEILVSSWYHERNDSAN